MTGRVPVAIVEEVGSQAAEQIIAGVVLSERLAVTMYGAIHRASLGGQRNLRGLIVDPKLLADDTFRLALTSPDSVAAAVALENPHIVPTVAVESGGSEVVVVTRGVGRYVTVQDLIERARSHGKKVPVEVAGAIGKVVVGALATAHKSKVVHGAVHPRSVLVDESGDVRLGDFVVGRALTSAVAQGAESSLWRGLSGYIAPELVVGEDPTPGADVFAVGALLFTLLTGELPPGALHATPAVERLVQRALDTDVARRYRSASDLLENFLEAMEDDRWELADKGEIIKAAGLASTDTNVDEATEDLLASLGSATSKSGMQVTAPIRPSIDLRAESSAARGKTIDALLADLDDNTGMTKVDDVPFKRDPISELIQHNPRKKEAIVQVKPRVPSLDDPDEDDSTPLPPPVRESDVIANKRAASSAPRSSSHDESAALDALAGLDEPVRRVATAADRLEKAADRAEEAASKAESKPRAPGGARPEEPQARTRAGGKPAKPIVDPIQMADLPVANLRSPFRYVIYALLLGGMGFGVWMIYSQYTKQGDEMSENAERTAREKAEKEELEARLRKELPDPGSIHVSSNPSQAGVWLKLGRTPVDTMPFSSTIQHELRLEGVAGYDPVDTQVDASAWTGEKKARKASISVALKAIGKDPKTGKPAEKKLPPTPPKPHDAGVLEPGRGPIHVESVPPGAEVWMYLGVAGEATIEGIQAGLPYELRVLADGYLPAFISITADEWRAGGDPNISINLAKKKQRLEKSVDLVADPNAPKPKH